MPADPCPLRPAGPRCSQEAARQADELHGRERPQQNAEASPPHHISKLKTKEPVLRSRRVTPTGCPSKTLAWQGETVNESAECFGGLTHTVLAWPRGWHDIPQRRVLTRGAQLQAHDPAHHVYVEARRHRHPEGVVVKAGGRRGGWRGKGRQAARPRPERQRERDCHHGSERGALPSSQAPTTLACPYALAKP